MTSDRPNTAHQLGNFVRRNALPVALGAVAILALTGGTAVAIWNTRIAKEQQQIALKRVDDVRSLFEAHDQIRLVPGSAGVRRGLLSKAVEYLDGLNVEHTKDDALLKEVAEAYMRIAYFQGGVTGTNVGNTAEALRTYRSALRILDDLWQRHPDDEWVGACRFAAVCNLSMMLADPAEGAALAGRYLPDVEAWIARDRGAPPLQASELIHAALGRTERAMGALDIALKQCELSADASHAALPLTHIDNAPGPMFGTWLDRSQNLFDTGLAVFARTETLLEMGRTIDAVQSAEDARALFEQSRRATADGKGGPSDDRMFARVHGLKAQTLWELHQPRRFDEALTEAKIEMAAASANMSDGMATSKRDLAEAHRHMGDILTSRGDVRGGLAELQQSAAMLSELAGADRACLMNRYLLAAVLNDYGNALLGSRTPAAAEAVFRRARDLMSQAVIEAPSWVELLRERARANSGVGRALVARAGPSDPAARDTLRQARADWLDFRKRSPLNQRYLDEQHAVLTLGSALR